MKKRVSILGSTGSIGCQALDIIARNRDQFSIVALTAHNQAEKLARQALSMNAEFAAIANPKKADELKDLLASGAGAPIKTASGAASVIEACHYPADIVILAISGIAGLAASFELAKHASIFATANKEAIICGGALLKEEIARSGCQLVPIDSEHHALSHLLKKYPEDKKHEIAKVILTASGGPFYDWSYERMKQATPQQAIRHPIWSMGDKISIDSANLMNKTLELIEAHFLFELAPHCLDMVIHRQSIIHALIETKSGIMDGFLSRADMRLVLADILGARDSGVEALDLPQIGHFTFEAVDHERFPSSLFAHQVLKKGGITPIILNSANEVAVEHFLLGKIGFCDISDIVGDMIELDIGHREHARDLTTILDIDKMARRKTKERINIMARGVRNT